MQEQPLDEPPPTVLEALGLEGVELVYAGSAPESHRRSRRVPIESADEFAREIMDQLSGPAPALVEVSVDVQGDLESLAADVNRLIIPAESIATLAISEETPVVGRLLWTDNDRDSQTLLARFPRGRGEILVVSDPQLLANRLLAGADNSVLAVRLLSPAGGAVRFDEFYHGLGVRGSPLYLLTRLPYAIVAMGLLLLLAVWSWRKAVFLGPPLPDVEANRRDISEYITAMGRFFAVGGSGRARLVQQVRDGVLRQISDEVRLPPDTDDLERIAASLARRDIRRGEMLLEATRAVDNELQSRRHWSEVHTLDAMQRMTDCLLKNATGPSAPSWRRLSSAKTT